MSVWGTVPNYLKLRSFSWKHGINHFIVLKDNSSSVLGLDFPDLPKKPAYHLKHGQPTPCWPSLLRPSIAVIRSTGILTRFPSTTHFCLALGADSPYADERCVGNLGLSASGLFTRFIATHVNIRTSDTSSTLYNAPSSAYRTLPYHASKLASAASVIDLSPVTSSAQDDSTSELLRFL